MCAQKFKVVQLPKGIVRENFTQFGIEFAVKYICVHSVCSICTHIVRMTICIAPYTYIVKDNKYPVTAMKAQRESRGVALLFL